MNRLHLAAIVLLVCSGCSVSLTGVYATPLSYEGEALTIRPDHTFVYRVWSDVGGPWEVAGRWQVSGSRRTGLITTIASDCKATFNLPEHHRIGCRQMWRINRGGAVRWGVELVRRKERNELR